MNISDTHEMTEQQALGAMLLDPEQAWQGLSTLTDEHLMSERNRHVFRAIRGSFEDATGTDLVAVDYRMLMDGTLDKVGGAYLAELCDACPAPSTLKQCAARLDVLYQRRRKTLLAEEALAAYRANDVAKADGFLEAAMISASATLPVKPMDQVHSDMVQQLKDECSTGQVGTACGFVEIDSLINGLMPGKSTIIGAHTHHGKTTLAMQMLLPGLLIGRVGMYFSLEASAPEALRRLSSLASSIRAGPKCWAKWSPDDREAFLGWSGQIRDLRLTLNDRCSPLPSILRAVRGARPRPDIVVVDHAQIVSVPKSDGGEESVRLTSAALKRLSLECECSVILLSQFHRGAAPTGKPRLSDLKHSSSLEQDADTVLLIERQIEKGMALVHVEKNRGFGRLGQAVLRWNGHLGRFEEGKEGAADDVDE